MSDVPVEWIAQAGVNFFIDGQRLKLISKCVVPCGGGNINGIRNIAGGLGLEDFRSNHGHPQSAELHVPVGSYGGAGPVPHARCARPNQRKCRELH